MQFRDGLGATKISLELNGIGDASLEVTPPIPFVPDP
jgi:hypothetical protein